MFLPIHGGTARNSAIATTVPAGMVDRWRGQPAQPGAGALGQHADPVGDAAREPSPRDPARDRDRRRAEHQVAVVAREPGLRLERDPEPPHQAEQRRARAATRAPGCRGPPDRCARHHEARVRHSPNAATNSAMIAGILTRLSTVGHASFLNTVHTGHFANAGAVRARVLGPGDAAQQVARAPQLGQEPQHRDQREQPDDELARARIAPEQVEPVRAPEEPQLGSVERGEEARPRTPAGAPRPCSGRPRSARARWRSPPSSRARCRR